MSAVARRAALAASICGVAAPVLAPTPAAAWWGHPGWHGGYGWHHGYGYGWGWHHPWGWHAGWAPYHPWGYGWGWRAPVVVAPPAVVVAP